MVKELTRLYEAYSQGKDSPLEELPIQYVDYAVWQREWLQGAVLEEQVEYWKKQLGGVEALELPTSYGRPAEMSHRGETVKLRLAGAMTEKLKELGRREGVTLFMVLLAGFQVVLWRYTGQEDIAVGTPIAGRGASELEELIGFFVNTLVMRSDLSGEPSLREVLGRVRQVGRAGSPALDRRRPDR